MFKKKSLLKLVVLELIAIVLLSLLFNKNILRVTAESPLDIDSVRIEFGIAANTINRENDLALFENRERYTVLFDGAEKNGIVNEYGENDFLLTYADRYYLSFRQFKFNRKNQHDYHFDFFSSHDSIFVHVNIKGKDGMDFEHVLLPIRDAGKFRCNVPIDSAGVIYDMIELVDPKK